MTALDPALPVHGAGTFEEMLELPPVPSRAAAIALTAFGRSCCRGGRDGRIERMVSRLILVKHALPVLQANIPARKWLLGEEGEQQARTLAKRLEPFLPFTLASSSEPKAVRTAEIVAAETGISTRVVAGLEEFDRPALPLLPREEHDRLNAEIFANPSRVVIGRESGAIALRRFRTAVRGALDLATGDTLVLITHGTVVSLLVAAHNPGIDAFQFWRRLECASFAVLAMPGFAVQEQM